MDEIFSFGYWLRRRRKALDLTQKELAQRVGCATGTIKNIEADVRRPSKQLAARLADSLELTAAERDTFLKASRAELTADRLVVSRQPALPTPTDRAAVDGDRSIGSVEPISFPKLPASQPMGIIIFLLTDIEGSTRLWEQHPTAMPAALARHDAILAEVITAQHGLLVKTTGDGVLAVFWQAPDALTAAFTAQRALRRENWGMVGALPVRMALHAGVAEARAGDYFGPSLNRTARLLAAGHGGQILLSRAAVELLHDHLPSDLALRDLGVHRLKDLSRPEHIYQVVVPDLPSEFPSLRTLDARPNNLPTQPTALLGRKREVDTLGKLLRRDEVRLVTLTGPGGVGKTRLALQVGADLLDVYTDGIWFVDLAPISDPELVVATIAHTLGVRETSTQPLIEQLRTYLHAKRLLLLLDNFEQVVDAAPRVAELLAAAPQSKILVTSRTVLRLRGEKEYTVPPLPLPDPHQQPPLASLSQYAAVELFIQRAQDVKEDFQVTNANAPAVAEICARLDGLPLAIELAAAWVKLFAPETLLARLERRLGVLVGGPRDVPARQQTIRNTIDWSYHLLEEGEKTLFARLAVFVGGCMLKAAEAVCNAEGDLGTDVLDGLAALVDKSLLRQAAGSDGAPRFVMFETIREYALERLEESRDGQELQRLHATYYLALAEAAKPALQGPEKEVWLERLELEHDNLRAALQRTLDQNAAELAARLSGALWEFWEMHGHLSEGRRWFERTLAESEAISAAVQATVLHGAANLAAMQGDDGQALMLYTEALALYRTVGDTRRSAWVLAHIGFSSWQRGDDMQATAQFTESLSLFRALGDTRGIATSLQGLGRIAQSQGQLERAEALLTESLARCRDVGDKSDIAWVLNALGSVAVGQGEFGRATALFEESLTLFRELGHKMGISGELKHLGEVALLQGNFEQAAALLKEGLALARALADKGGIALALHLLSIVGRECPDPVGNAAQIDCRQYCPATIPHAPRA